MAILGDSFREALDTKVFTVLVGISIMLTALTASASFEPEGVETIMNMVVLALNDQEPMPVPRLQRPAQPKPAPEKSFQVRSVKAADGSRGTPASAYHVVLLATFADPARARE